MRTYATLNKIHSKIPETHDFLSRSCTFEGICSLLVGSQFHFVLCPGSLFVLSRVFSNDAVVVDNIASTRKPGHIRHNNGHCPGNAERNFVPAVTALQLPTNNCPAFPKKLLLERSRTQLRVTSTSLCLVRSSDMKRRPEARYTSGRDVFPRKRAAARIVDGIRLITTAVMLFSVAGVTTKRIH